jgi:hypothetical protein
MSTNYSLSFLLTFKKKKKKKKNYTNTKQFVTCLLSSFQIVEDDFSADVESEFSLL